MELGLGIHGEPGAWRGPAQPIDAIVAQVRFGVRFGVLSMTPSEVHR